MRGTEIAKPISALVLAAAITPFAAQSEDAKELRVKQEPGKITYWILPGERKLDPAVFGTPDAPKMTVADKVARAQELVGQGKAPPSVPQLLRDLPILVGVPMQARSRGEDGAWVLKHPNPFGNDARIVDGYFDVTYKSEVDKDPKGPPGKTPDSADFRAQFTDPDGNLYRVDFDHVVKPPFPGYETQGGVMIDSTHHGDTGTGTPLMPEVKTYGALWGIGDLYVNGKLVEPHRVMHLMTTEVVRNREYQLVQEADLPLPPEERHIRDQAHHTHLVIFPIQPVKGEGPTFKPLEHGYTLPNGKKQPFIHVMFEQDEIAGS